MKLLDTCEVDRDRRRDICEAACAGIKNPAKIRQLVAMVREIPEQMCSCEPEVGYLHCPFCGIRDALSALDAEQESEVRK